MTEYRAASGALVFSAGTIQYSWALDDHHSVYQTATDPALQQATINLFADMGVQPGYADGGHDSGHDVDRPLAPISTILSPLAGAVLRVRHGCDNPRHGARPRRRRGRGGRSFGRRRHDVAPRDRHESWTYTFTTRGNGPFTILSRAVDDSGNMEPNGPAWTVNPILNPGIYSLWTYSDTPGTIDSKDKQAIEVGVRITSRTRTERLPALRFYKATTNTGTHVANLWTSTGQLLATATFTNETG